MSISRDGSSHPIRIVGAREHNLRNLTFELPTHRLVALAGVSGAGKTTIARHIIAQIARRRLGRLRGEIAALAPAYQPDVDAVEGLPPIIEIAQEPLRGQSRSTVATYTGLLHLLGGLFLHHGESRSPSGAPVVAVKSDQFAAWLWRHHAGSFVTVAKVRADLTVASASHLPEGTFYYRENRTPWSQGTRAASKSLLPARWWIAQPVESHRLTTEKDACKLVRDDPSDWLWVIDDKLFIEGREQRIAADDPLPYGPLGRPLFSFNIAATDGGQCRTCAGLGVMQGVRVESLVCRHDQPLLNGGFSLPQTRGRFNHLGVLDDILRGFFHTRGFKADVTWKELPADARQVVLYGSGREPIPELRSGEKRPRPAKRAFAGLIPLVLARAASKGPAARIFQAWVGQTVCPDCAGSRFNRTTRACVWRDHRWADLVAVCSLGELRDLLASKVVAARGSEADLLHSLGTLLDAYGRLNLGHLPLDRATSTLSGGEAQRLKLGLALALELSGAGYVLDEPSRGLHPQDLTGLQEMLRAIVLGGNSVILVEHQPRLLADADHVLTLGPGGGDDGGKIISVGPPAKTEKRQEIKQPTLTKPKHWIEVADLHLHNLRGVSFRLPCARVTAVVGVSGAGKSSAILHALVPVASGAIEGAGESPLCKIRVPQEIRFVEVVGQKLAAQNRRSIVATALELFDSLRAHYASLPESKAMGLKAADFSFNSTGACPACAGSGFAHDGFDEETTARCHSCGGSRFASSALLVESADTNLAALLAMPISSLVVAKHPAFSTQGQAVLQMLIDLGLGHLALGRATPTLSAGERQRLALARFLTRLEERLGSGLLVLDEPTAGLNLADATRVFERVTALAREHAHTVIVLEHKLELLQRADWVLEFGPGSGPNGGQVIFQGPSDSLQTSGTPTAQALTAQPASRRTYPKLGKADAAKPNILWNRCADAFEPLATRLNLHDETELVRPVHPAVKLDAERIPDDTRVGEILELLPWVRTRARPAALCGAKNCVDEHELSDAVRGQAFSFSPVARELRIGLVVPSDLRTAATKLSQLGFDEAECDGVRLPLRKLGASIKTPEQLNALRVWCPVTAPEPQRALALRLSEGVVHIGGPQGQTLTTRFLDSSGAIGLALQARHAADYRSPQGQCVQCFGKGRLRAYPWQMVVADDRRTLTDDAFWHPAVLPAIRALRRTRLVPEAEFFAREWAADFKQPPKKMDSRTRLLFEHGIPWRRFLKPSAKRTDREQDYFSWRGLHDYVFHCLGRMADAAHKQRLRENVITLLCPACEGTGMGWESILLDLQGMSLRDAWSKLTLKEWRDDLRCDSPALAAAIGLGFDGLRPSDRWEEIPSGQRNSLILALAHTAPLAGLSLVMNEYKKLPVMMNAFFQRECMTPRFT